MSVFPVNATIVFQIGTGRFEESDHYGNEPEKMQPLTVKASLKLDQGKQQRILQQPGNNESVSYFVGYCANPKFMPQSIKEGVTGKCTIKDLATGSLLIGNLTITSLMQSQFKQVTRSLGSKFEAYFVAV